MKRRATRAKQNAGLAYQTRKQQCPLLQQDVWQLYAVHRCPPGNVRTLTKKRVVHAASMIWGGLENSTTPAGVAGTDATASSCLGGSLLRVPNATGPRLPYEMPIPHSTKPVRERPTKQVPEGGGWTSKREHEASKNEANKRKILKG